MQSKAAAQRLAGVLLFRVASPRMPRFAGDKQREPGSP